MGGINPYIQPSDRPLPTKTYKVLFRAEGREREVSVNPDSMPYGRDGLAGSLLDIALGHGIEIDHACGGVCACSTCHVIVRQGIESCGEADEAEDDQLDNAPGLTPQSRLSCQCVPNGTTDLVVEVPDWNRNAAQEEPH